MPSDAAQKVNGLVVLASGALATRRLDLVSAKSLRNGAVAMHYRREGA